MLIQKLLLLLCILLHYQLAAAKKSPAKGPNYQQLYQKCQDQKTACVVITFTQGYNRAFLTGEPNECANDGNAGVICTYGPGAAGKIRCKHADFIGISSTGTTIEAVFYGNASSSFSSSGDRSSIFVASCLTQG